MREASRSSSPSNQAPAAERRRRETGDFEPFPGLRVREDDVLRVQQESGVTREGRASAGRLDKDTCGNAGPTAILGPVGSTTRVEEMASTGLPGDIGSTGEIGGGSSLRIAPISDA